jgi:hypothetical protein
MAVAALAFLLVPAVGSVYPVPAPPVNLFPYIFAAYFLIGVGLFVVRRKFTMPESAVVANISEEAALAS